MPDQDLCPSLQQCQKKTVRWPGTWRLAPKRAISLMPRKPSQLLIVQGRAWITWEFTSGYSSSSGTDRFLAAGESMDVPAGVRLVMESVESDQVLDFDWRVMPVGLLHRSTHAGPSLWVLARQWLFSWLQLGRASIQLLHGLLGKGLRMGRTGPLPGRVI